MLNFYNILHDEKWTNKRLGTERHLLKRLVVRYWRERLDSKEKVNNLLEKLLPYSSKPLGLSWLFVVKKNAEMTVVFMLKRAVEKEHLKGPTWWFLTHQQVYVHSIRPSLYLSKKVPLDSFLVIPLFVLVISPFSVPFLTNYNASNALLLNHHLHKPRDVI